MSSFGSERGRAILPAAMLLLAVLLFVGACTEDSKNSERSDPPGGKTKMTEETTSLATTGLETTGDSRPPEVTLGDDTGGQPEVVIRLEGDPKTTFSGLCSVGEERNVLSGQVPKRFAFDLKGRQLSCRIEKQDGGEGDLKVVLVAGETTRSVQQTNSPGGVIKISYEEE
ncbi:MAG: hypothetical protein H0U55_01320 [Rubrobacteraceae bacterium]|nr:hypothetical protein [Rubrobacteraceae bacterium]